MSYFPISIAFCFSHVVSFGPPPSQILRCHTSPRRSAFFFIIFLVWSHLQVKFLDGMLSHVDQISSFRVVSLAPPPRQILRWLAFSRRSPFIFLMLLVWAHLRVKFLDVMLPHVDHLFSFSCCLCWSHLQVNFSDVIIPHVDHFFVFSCCWFWPTSKSNS